MGETGNTGFNYADLDVNSNKLGATVVKRNEKLVKLLRGALRAEIDKIINEIGI